MKCNDSQKIIHEKTRANNLFLDNAAVVQEIWFSFFTVNIPILKNSSHENLLKQKINQ